jgi:hypothetical protein
LKINVKQYLLVTSVFAIFTEGLFFNFIIDWKLIYLIILSNYVILIKYYKLKLNNYFILLLIAFFVHGIITNLFIGIPPNFMLAQIIGIAIMGIYYYNFVSLYSLDEIISLYVKICFYVAIIGYVFYFLNFHPLAHLSHETRLMSIFKEPAHYSVVVMPACYYYLKTKKYFRFLVIFGTLILTNSSLGYLGCALMFIIPNLSLKRIGYLLSIVPVIIGVFYYVYTEYPFLKLRVDDTYETLNSVNTGKFKEQTNMSSYAILSNLFVANENVEDHPFGSGIGSHLYVYENIYRKQMRAPEYLKKQNLEKTNATDANSLFIRMFSEMGILGVILIFILIYLAYKAFSLNNNDMYLAQGIFIYLLLKLFRDGHYFPPEFYMFIWLLYFGIKKNKKEINEM